ncbi:PfkB family carbohydrate kinase [Brevundimonas lenta]|uniref:2-dehydro-3-deoxygluconokinase n=1 Tax=Brevundimonas lenta TaxID=424796 RepID=A0A7W6JEG6_9CAUL|nr:2-dehydro-3-deoxygluconokinase [Brevundimonas lenta]
MKIVSFGECMLELSRSADGEAKLRFGGDTFNTALYLARLGVKVRYATALGADVWSQEMKAAWAEEGVDLDLVLTDPHRLPGLYAIRTGAAGERTFSYWRETSAARNFFRLPGSEQALAAMAEADLLYVSGISLSLFDDADRAQLQAVARTVRDRGGDVAFDPNYRPRNWASADEARRVIADFAPLVTVALPTFEDEAALHGDATPEATAERWRSHGAREVVVKLGPDGALLADDSGLHHIATAPVDPVDTTGAGDSFNAGYLHARLSRQDAPSAVRAGHALARRVIRYPGAIIPR